MIQLQALQHPVALLGVFRLDHPPDAAGQTGEGRALEILAKSRGIAKRIRTLGDNEGNLGRAGDGLQFRDNLFENPFAIGADVLLELIDHHEANARPPEKKLPKFREAVTGVESHAGLRNVIDARISPG